MISDYFASLSLPQCAVSVNGEILEEMVIGYRTSSVSGRETLSSELDEITIGDMDGKRFRSKKDNTRDITISYALVADDREKHHTLSDKLKEILSVENAEFSFKDESNIYYIGTVQEISSEFTDASGTNLIVSTGEIILHCSDPYKYSSLVKTAQNSSGGNTIVLVNEGTKSVPINIKAKMNSENGFLGFILEERFYQIGDPGEVDGETYEQSDMLFDDHLTSDKGWLVNQGVTPPVTPERLQNGTIGYVLESAATDEGYAHTTNYGSGNSWHGGSITKIVPPDINGEYPVNWSSNWRIDFNTVGSSQSTKGKEVGHNSVTFIDENDNIICSVVFEDNHATLERSDMAIYIGSTRVWDTRNTTKFYVTSRPNTTGPVSVEKLGNKITITVGYAGIKKTYTTPNPNAELRKITWYGAAYKSYTPIHNNLIRALHVKKHNVEYYKDIPNYFSSGDEVEINGDNNEVYINGMKDWDMVDIGSQPLMLPPGEHILGISVSDFSTIPDVTVEWRERWR